MYNSVIKKIMAMAVFVAIASNALCQDNVSWWNSLSPAWKKIFRDQELKGMDVDPTEEQLANIVNIEELNCSGNKQIEDLKPLARLTLLKSLDCSNTNISSLTGIETLRNLEYLNCSNNDNINSLIPVQTLANLKEINCGNTMVKNLAPLRNLINLKKLDVHFCTVNNLNMISELKSLTSLNVSQNQSLFGISGVDRLTSLTDFDCSETSVRDLEPLKNAKNLETINCAETEIVTLRPLQSVRTLKEIDCSGTRISAASLDYLHSHMRLTMLRARRIDVTQKQIDDFTKSFSINHVNCDVIITTK